MSRTLHVALDRSTQRTSAVLSMPLEAIASSFSGSSAGDLRLTADLLGLVRAEKRRPEIELPLPLSRLTHVPARAHLAGWDATLAGLAA
jgi:hypothetical protein